MPSNRGSSAPTTLQGLRKSPSDVARIVSRLVAAFRSKRSRISATVPSRSSSRPAFSPRGSPSRRVAARAQPSSAARRCGMRAPRVSPTWGEGASSADHPGGNRAVAPFDRSTPAGNLGPGGPPSPHGGRGSPSTRLSDMASPLALRGSGARLLQREPHSKSWVGVTRASATSPSRWCHQSDTRTRER